MVPPESQPRTLGDVLYADKRQWVVSESTWVGHVQSVVEHDQLALHALYARMDGVVFTWLTQIVRDRETAEKLTLDVFHEVWRGAPTYDPADGSVIGWILNQARSRTIDWPRIPSTPTFDSVVSPSTDVLRPSTSLWLPLSRRIAAETGEEPLLPLPEGQTEPEWEDVAPGISCKLLATDRQQGRVAMLVRLTPGTAYPPHTNGGIEELYLLRGELMIEDRTLYPGDYNRGEPGDSDQFVWSGTGCMCILLTSTRDLLNEAPPTDPAALRHFRTFLNSLRSYSYCLDCLRTMYDEPASAVWTCLRENGILGRYAECANCGSFRQIFRSL